MELFKIHPTKVKLNTDLPRFRQEMGDVKDLALSIKEKGQIQPIVINKDLELVAGGRRLAACMLANIECLAIYSDAADPITMRELEIEENIQRKQFTPAEEISAIAELHQLKQAKYGESGSGRKGGHTLKDTAALIGKTKGTVIEAMSLADAINRFPELKTCKTKAEIKKAARAIENVAHRATKKVEYETYLKSQTKKPFELYNESANAFYERLAPESVDILLTDPPYGIEINETATSTGGRTGAINSAGFTFNDSREDVLQFYTTLAERSIVFTKPTSHAFVFVGPEHFTHVRDTFKSVGWLVYIKPIIWIKRETGQCNAPHAWPASCYEMLMYARRVDSRLVKEGQPDWIECDPVLGSAKRHPTEKPVKLLRNLISRVAEPGSILVDPFMGSGASIEAATTEQCYAMGCDLLGDAYNVALERMVAWTQNQAMMTTTF